MRVLTFLVAGCSVWTTITEARRREGAVLLVVASAETGSAPAAVVVMVASAAVVPAVRVSASVAAVVAVVVAAAAAASEVVVGATGTIEMLGGAADPARVAARGERPLAPVGGCPRALARRILLDGGSFLSSFRASRHARSHQDDLFLLRPCQLHDRQEQADPDREARNEEVLPRVPEAPSAQGRQDLQGLRLLAGPSASPCVHTPPGPRLVVGARLRLGAIRPAMRSPRPALLRSASPRARGDA